MNDFTANTLGGWVKCLKETIPLWNVYYFYGKESVGRNLTEKEIMGGFCYNRNKLIPYLKKNGLRVKPNVVEMSIILKMVLNNPSAIRINVGNIVTAINRHHLLSFYEAALSNNRIYNGKDKVKVFWGSDKVKNYYQNIQLNNEYDLNKIP